MPMHHAQRQHIIQSLTSLLYQLHTVSFLVSPRLWPFICRLSTQFHFSRPREVDSQRSLRFWFIMVLLVNMQCFYHHIFRGAAEGRSIILDFVGIAHKPTKAFLLSLDVVIVLLEFILITIAYETSFTLAMSSDTQDPLQPELRHSAAPSPLLGQRSNTKMSDVTSYEDENEYIIDLRLRPLLQRLRHPPVPPVPQQRNLSENLLPLPNTTAFQLSRSLNMLVRARAELRERAARAAETGQTNRPRGDRDRRQERQPGEPNDTETRRVPGGMGGEEEL